MLLPEAFEAFLAHRRAGNCGVGTIGLYGRQLETWRVWLITRNRNVPIADLVIEDLRDFMAHLRTGYVSYASEASSRKPSSKPLSENTLASYYRTLRTFWSFLGIEQQLSPEQRDFFARIATPSVPKDPRPVTDADAVRRLLAACGDGSTEESARNRAILLLLQETGMRISELCNLTDEVVDPNKRRARLLRTKGKKHRMVFWKTAGAIALARYLLARRGKHGGPLFRGCSIRNNGGKITPDLVRALVKRIAAEARIKLPKGAPLHSIRHGFAHEALDNGAQITELADLMGHADLETTRIYLRNDDDRLEAVYDRIFSRQLPRRSARGDAESHG